MKRLLVTMNDETRVLLDELTKSSGHTISKLLEDAFWRSPRVRRIAAERGLSQPGRPKEGRPRKEEGK
jgi:predicted DNA-binding ribbon-helix-helix protein